MGVFEKILSEIDKGIKTIKPLMSGDTRQIAESQIIGLEESRKIIEKYKDDVGWIPCSERMPEMHKEQLEDGEYCMISDSVLATDGNSVFISDYEADDDYHFGWNHDGIKCESEITHWMPLPKPYREEGIDWPKRVDYEGEVHWN